MENKEKIEWSEVQRWSITNTGVRWLPEQLKSAQELYEIDDMEAYSDELDFYGYGNWRVFEINVKYNLKKYIKYPSLYKLLSDLKAEWNDERVLILHKQPTPKFLEKLDKWRDRASDILTTLIDVVKQSKSKDDFYKMAEKYRNEIISALQDDNNSISDMMTTLWDLAELHGKWEINDQEVEEYKEGCRSFIQTRKFMTPIHKSFFYMKWTKERIKELKNKFLEHWSNVFVIT